MAEPGTTSLRTSSSTCDDSTLATRATSWTCRRAIADSAPIPLAVTIVAVAVAVISSISAEVPFAAAIGVAATAPAVLVDVLERRLPNRLVAGAATVTATTSLLTATAGADVAWANGFTGAALMAAPLLIVHLVTPSAMGFGDVKLALVLGFAVGLVQPTSVLIAVLVASAGTALLGLITRRRTIAFGPGLALGSTAVLLVAALGLGDIAGIAGIDHLTTSTHAEGA